MACEVPAVVVRLVRLVPAGMIALDIVAGAMPECRSWMTVLIAAIRFSRLLLYVPRL